MLPSLSPNLLYLAQSSSPVEGTSKAAAMLLNRMPGWGMSERKGTGVPVLVTIRTRRTSGWGVWLYPNYIKLGYLGEWRVGNARCAILAAIIAQLGTLQ